VRAQFAFTGTQAPEARLLSAWDISEKADQFCVYGIVVPPCLMILDEAIFRQRIEILCSGLPSDFEVVLEILDPGVRVPE